MGVAAALLLSVLAAITGAIHYLSLINEAARAVADADPDDVNGERASSVIGALVSAIPTLAVAVWLGFTARGLHRGHNVSRILSALGLAAPVLLGLLSCCVGGAFAGILGLTLAGGGEFDSGTDDYSEFDYGSDYDSAFYDKLDSLDTGAFSTVVGVIGNGLSLLALGLAAAALILLFTGPANRFFRPQVPGFPPPFGYPPPYGYPQPYAYGPPMFAASPPFPQAPPFPQPPAFYGPPVFPQPSPYSGPAAFPQPSPFYGPPPALPGSWAYSEPPVFPAAPDPAASASSDELSSSAAPPGSPAPPDSPTPPAGDPPTA
ncbi:hypothetical protein BJ973_003679 [Actinoplanes tereljensis]|uniref:hypothetical protein n=1 Tax=Paractinoplanes tereljensis TaxID=571912 RepID=UPI0019430DC0|nr:hypothetical protein [Actinoplanes tereljensis]